MLSLHIDYKGTSTVAFTRRGEPEEPKPPPTTSTFSASARTCATYPRSGTAFKPTGFNPPYPAWYPREPQLSALPMPKLMSAGAPLLLLQLIPSGFPNRDRRSQLASPLGNPSRNSLRGQITHSITPPRLPGIKYFRLGPYVCRRSAARRQSRRLPVTDGRCS